MASYINFAWEHDNHFLISTDHQVELSWGGIVIIFLDIC